MSKKTSRLLTCPACSTESILRNSRPRNSKEKLIKFIPILEIYRCKKCGWRGWKINFKINVKIIKKLILYILLMILAAIIVYNILKLVV